MAGLRPDCEALNMETQDSTSKLERVICSMAAASIASTAVSITMSHGLIILCFLLYPFNIYFENRKNFHHDRSSNKRQMILALLRKGLGSGYWRQLPRPLVVGFCFYILVFVYKLIHLVKEPQALTYNLGAVWSDAFFVLFALMLWKLASKPQNLRFLYLGLLILVGVMLLTGILAVFKLSDFILSPFRESITTPLLFTWKGIAFHRGSGFIRVPLTYACLLAMLVPFLLGSMFYLLFECRRYFAALFMAFLNCCAFLLLWFNGTRSASVALLLCFPFVLYFLIRNFFVKQKTVEKNPKFSKMNLLAFMFVLIALISGFFYMDRSATLMMPYERNENLRGIIWTQAGQMLLKNPFLGVGPGNYKKSALAQWDTYYKETKKPSVKNLVPVGHAHSDILYFAAIGGIPMALFFLYLIYVSIHFVLQKRNWQGTCLAYGCVCLFIAGLAECYFIDSEVVSLFWILVILADASPRLALLRRAEEAKQRRASILRRFKEGLAVLKLPRIQKSRVLAFTERATLVFLVSAIVSISFSLSLCFTAIILSFFFWLIHKLLAKIDKKQLPVIKDEKTAIDPRRAKILLPRVFLMSIALFGVILISDIYHFLFSSYPSQNSVSKFFSVLMKGDLMLMLFAILVWRTAQEESKLKTIKKGFTILIILLIIFSLASLFSDLPLSSPLLGQLNYSSSNRPQNLLFTLGGIAIYSPQGFMSTRLTCAGMLIAVLPYLIGEGLQSFSQKKNFQAAFYTFFFVLGFCVLWLTGVRSALLGLVGSLLIFLGSLRLRLTLVSFKKITKQNKKILSYVFVGFFLLILGLITLVAHFKLHKDLLRPVLRLSDFGRAFMWSESGEIIKEYPVSGVGSKNYSYVSANWRKEFLEVNPDTWYFMHFIPKGHAHSDILDLWYKHGFFAVFFYLAVFFLVLKYMFYPVLGAKGERRNIFLLCGCVALFLAGFAQCYLMDDEVGLIFWLSLALGLGTGPQRSALSS